MAKQIDRGEVLEIYYDNQRDNLKKFQKFIRNAVTQEKKNILVEMACAPVVPKDYLATFVFGAQALKSYGYSVTFVVSPENYTLLKSSEHGHHFNLEIGQVVSDEEIRTTGEAQPTQVDIPCFTIDGNTIHISEEEVDEIPTKLAAVVQSILKQNYQEVKVDLTEVFLLTPPVLQSLILETLNSGNCLRIRIQESMREVIESNPQAMILNLDCVKEEEPNPGAPSLQSSDSERREDREDREEAFGLDFEDEDEVQEAEVAQHSSMSTMQKEEPSSLVAQENIASLFPIEVNCMKVGKMPVSAFVENFLLHFSKLYDCGNRIYVDLTDFSIVEPRVVRELLLAHFEAMARKKQLVIRLFQTQEERWNSLYPILEQVKEPEDTSPKFIIMGSRLELHNVGEEIFLEEFQSHLRELLATGNKKLVVDISHLESVSSQQVEMLILSYLEATGNGLAMTLRIRPEMEDAFQKSGRGRMLSLEVIKPELSAKVATSPSAPITTALNMGKIQEAMEKDRLTNKVLQKQYESVHIESRGTVSNWEPSPVKGSEKEIDYKGTERRKDKRYKTKNLEVSFAKGTLGKITGRRYPLHNLSLTGACFTTSVSVSRSEPVRLKIFSEETSVEISAKVIWSSPIPAQALFRVGVQFNKVSDFVNIQIKELIGKLYSQEKTQ